MSLNQLSTLRHASYTCQTFFCNLKQKYSFSSESQIELVKVGSATKYRILRTPLKAELIKLLGTSLIHVENYLIYSRILQPNSRNVVKKFTRNLQGKNQTFWFLRIFKWFCNFSGPCVFNWTAIGLYLNSNGQFLIPRF